MSAVLGDQVTSPPAVLVDHTDVSIALLPDGHPTDRTAFSGITQFLTKALAGRCHDLGLGLRVVEPSVAVPTEDLLRRLASEGRTTRDIAAEMSRHHQHAGGKVRRAILAGRRKNEILISMNSVWPYIGDIDIPIVYYLDCSLAAFYLHRRHGTVPRRARHPVVAASLRRLEGSALAKAARICCFSDAARREIQATYGIPERALCVIGAGVNLTKFPPYRHRKRVGPMRVLFVGRDFVRKGGPLVAGAIKLLSSTGYHFTFITNPSEASSYLEPAPHIQIFGPCSPATVSRCMKEAHVLVAPSAVEPYGMALSEGMAHSLPVIATRRYAIPEILGAGNPGLLRSASAVSLANSLSELTSDSAGYQRLAMDNYLRASALHRWSDVAGRLIQSALLVANGHRAP